MIYSKGGGIHFRKLIIIKGNTNFFAKKKGVTDWTCEGDNTLPVKECISNTLLSQLERK